MRRQVSPISLSFKSLGVCEMTKSREKRGNGYKFKTFSGFYKCFTVTAIWLFLEVLQPLLKITMQWHFA